eukprot:2628215-Pyramimonas_sp.AAC.1
MDSAYRSPLLSSYSDRKSFDRSLPNVRGALQCYDARIERAHAFRYQCTKYVSLPLGREGKGREGELLKGR